MSKRVISFGLSESEIDRAMQELNDYKRELIRKTELLQKKVTERLREEAQRGFNGAVVDDLLRGGQKLAQVKVTVGNRGDITLVIANGEDAVWVEFGAGVYHNGTPGTSPHPHGAELGMLIGGYGKGNGKKEVWGYYDGGELKLTHGTPARMPMTRAVTTVLNDIQSIVKEVWG